MPYKLPSTNTCKDCGTLISRRSTFCKKCRFKGDRNPWFGCVNEKNPNYRTGIRSNKPPKCIDCSTNITVGRKRCVKCDYKHRIGEGNSNWKGGISFEPYNAKFTIKLKEKIRLRDGLQCCNCGMHEYYHKEIYQTVLTIHHIDYNKQNCADNNLITLCVKCNSLANSKRDFWKIFYTIMVNRQ